MTESDLIEAIKVYRFEPGDRLIVRCPGRCSMDTADRIKAMMEQWAPGVKVAVFSEGMTLDILRGVPSESQWKSSNPDVATVDSSGWVSPVSAGSVLISHHDGGRISTWHVEVHSPGVITAVWFTDDAAPRNPDTRPRIGGIPHVPNGHVEEVSPERKVELKEQWEKRFA